MLCLASRESFEGKLMGRKFGPGPGGTFGVVARSIRKIRRWKGFATNGTVAAVGNVSKTLLAPVDYEQSTTLEPSGVTMGGIRLSLSFQSDLLPMFGTFMIYKLDNDETAQSGVTTLNLTDEDVIWSGSWATTIETPCYFSVHTKTMRKLHNDKINIVIKNNSGSAGVYDLISRVMVLGG